MDNINNDYTKEMDAINLKIMKENEEKDENAAIVIQYFFLTYVVFNRYERPSKELLLIYNKLKARRSLQSFKDFKEEIKILVIKNRAIEEARRKSTPWFQDLNKNRSKSVPLIEIPNTEGNNKTRRAFSTEILHEHLPLASARRADFKSSFARDANDKENSLRGASRSRSPVLETIEDEIKPKRTSTAFISDSDGDDKYLLQIIIRKLCCYKRKNYLEESKYESTRLYKKMPLTYFLVQFLSKPSVAVIINVILLYHIFIYMYLGILKGDSSFYTGFMYSTCYAGVVVSYWILYRQKQQMLDWTYILSNELISNFVEKKGRPFNQYELIEQNQRYHLVNYDPGYKAFVDYCVSWETLVVWFIFIWQGCTTIGIILKLSNGWENVFGNSFDNNPLALYGYYNLFGQYIASIILLTSAATLFTGFYNLRCLILCYCGDIRKYRLLKFNSNSEEEEEKTKQRYLDLRDEYLYLQKCCVILGDVWTKPVMISSIFALQVIISNIFVIQKQVEYCEDGCSLFIIFPIIWCLTGIYLLHMILNGISSINDSAAVIKQVFTYSTSGLNLDSNKGDYVVIGGRERWLEYIDSNPIELKIGGTVVTKKYVINSISTIVVGVGSFALSNLLN